VLAIVAASVCYLEACLVSVCGSSCLLQLLQVLLPNSIAGPGLSCTALIIYDLHRVMFRSHLLPIKVACGQC